MTLRDLPACRLLEMLLATRGAPRPDPVALDALRREVERRLATQEADSKTTKGGPDG